ncbi:hypothetical protein Holit_02834 [Hollandina sp. SP2]
MDSWKFILSEYEFLLWDIKRFDINSTRWTKQAFEAQMYACVCDYIRLYAVYHYGGIYLDMDMEVIKTFDNFLQNDLMLAYENHISENIEAGCFGAIKGHPYIHKCLEYFENRYFCDPELFPNILKMEKTKRHDAIDPPILPDVMKIVLKEFFSSEKYPIFTHDYFTVKNVETGKIETTSNTVTIHHFATDYHSEEWRKIRAWEQHVKLVLGEKNILSKILIAFGGVARHTKDLGICKALKYYFYKYVKKEAG